jgi:ribonuclease Z
MPRWFFLGSAYAVADAAHENTHMVVEGRERMIMIDCVNNPIMRLQQLGLDHHQLTDLVLTHFHPDHVSGVSLLLMNLWLLGRKHLLNIYGLHHTLDRVESLMAAHDWGHWPNFFPVAFHRLPKEEMTLAFESADFRMFTSPVKHLLPTIGVRVELREIGQTVAYSCDTEPCPQIVNLARGADVLIHEAAGEGAGHSSATQAAMTAVQAGAKRLYLVHYPVGGFDASPLVAEAKKVFPGEVILAEDYMEIPFD